MTSRAARTKSKRLNGGPEQRRETDALFQLLGDHLEERDVVWCVGSHAPRFEASGARMVVLEFDGQNVSVGGATGLEALPAPTVIALVDVLSRAADPVATLLDLRRRSGRAQLFVAEPRAFGGRAVRAPRRRHYSAALLQKTLLRGGFVTEHWLVDTSFTGGLAAPLPDPVVLAFQMAHASEPHAALGLGRIEPEHGPEVHVEALVARAERHCDEGHGDPAAECYLRALAASPEHAPALAGLSRLSLHGGDVPRASELASRAFQLDPACVDAAVSMALCLERLCPEAAIEAWRHARDLEPSDAAIVTSYARSASIAGDTRSAVNAMEQLLEYGGQGADFHVTLAWLLLKEQRAGDAAVEVELARAIDPEHPMLADLAGELGLS